MTTNFSRNFLSASIPLLFLWIVIFDWAAKAIPVVQYINRALFIIGCLLWLFLRWRSNQSITLPFITIPIALFIAYQGILIFRSPLPFHAVEIELSYIAYLLSFIFVVDSLQHLLKVAHWENAMLIVGLLFSIFNVALVVLWWLNWVGISGGFLPLPPFGYRLPGLFLNHPNIEAAYLNLIAPLVVIRALRSDRWSVRILWSLIFILFLFVEFFTSSRAGWLSLVVGCGTTLILIGLPRLKEGRADLQRVSLFFKSTKGILVILGVFVAVISVGIIFIWQANVTGHAPILSARVGIWSVGRDIFETAPVLGYGPGSFHSLSAEVNQIPPGFYLVHAHNIILQIAAEGGLVGILLTALMVLIGGYGFLQTWRNTSGSRHYHLAAYGGAILGMTIHHIFDFAFEAPLYTLSVLILIALALYEQKGIRLSPNRGLPVLFGLLAIFFIGSLYTLQGSNGYFNGVQLARDDRWEEGTSKICQSSKVSRITLFDFQCGLAEATVALEQGDNLIVSAAEHIRKGIDSDPYWPVHWANLAALEWSLGNHSHGLILMEEAVDRAPRNSTFALNLGTMYEQIGDTEAAQAAYRQAVLSDPWIMDTFAYQNHVGRILDLESLEEEIEGQYNPLDYAWRGWRALDQARIHDAKGYFEQALESNPRNEDAYTGMALVLLEVEDAHSAEKMVNIALLLNPSSPRVQLSAGLVAMIVGNEAKAMDHFTQMFHLLRNSNQSAAYYESTYFRTYLPFDKVPQLQQPQLNERTFEALKLLIEHLTEIGEDHLVKEIQRWIQRQYR